MERRENYRHVSQTRLFPLFDSWILMPFQNVQLCVHLSIPLTSTHVLADNLKGIKYFDLIFGHNHSFTKPNICAKFERNQ